MKKSTKKIIAGTLALGVLVFNLNLSYNNNSDKDSGFSLKNLSVSALGTQAECLGNPAKNNKHCRQNGSDATCVDSYFWESNDCYQ